MEEARNVLQKYVPENALEKILHILFKYKELHLKITQPRKTKLGDYRQLNAYKHQISINNNLNKYQFLLTLLHEIAHFLSYKKYGYKIKPHGQEWKQIYKDLLLPFIKTNIFPEELIPDLIKYAQNPKASTAGDGQLYLKLSQYNKPRKQKIKYIFELKKNDFFALPNGVTYQLLEKRRTRYKCRRLSNQKLYLIHQNAEVLLINIESL